MRPTGPPLKTSAVCVNPEPNNFVVSFVADYEVREARAEKLNSFNPYPIYAAAHKKSVRGELRLFDT